MADFDGGKVGSSRNAISSANNKRASNPNIRGFKNRTPYTEFKFSDCFGYTGILGLIFTF